MLAGVLLYFLLLSDFLLSEKKSGWMDDFRTIVNLNPVHLEFPKNTMTPK